MATPVYIFRRTRPFPMRIKALLLVLAITFTCAAPPAARANDEVNFDYFYGALQDQGDWFGTEQYGFVFQPRAAAGTESWRPYSDGYWSFTDDGWTWVSYEDFGWATYHYGRWAKLADVGWVWVPGYEWAPAWVSWRTSPRDAETTPDVASSALVEDTDSDYIGWAPLPPEAILDASVGIASDVDATYDIGPANYCFVPTRYFGAPVLVAVILAPQQNIFFIGRTQNVTHCYYAGGRRLPWIYCGGPRFASLYRRVERPIPRLVIERRAPAAFGTHSTNAPGLRPPMQVIRGNTLQVAAPRVIPPQGVAPTVVGIPRQASPLRPATVKAEIARAERVRGWNAPGIQPQVVQAARDQVRREATQVPPRAAVLAATPQPNAGRVAVPSVASAPTPPTATGVAPRSQPVPPFMRVAPSTLAAAPRVSRPPDSAQDVPSSEVARSDGSHQQDLAELKKREAARQAQQAAVEQQRRAEAAREKQLLQQQAADLDRRQRLIAEQQQRRPDIQQQQRDAVDQQNAMRQQQIDAQRRAEAEARARQREQREQQGEQQRQAQAAAQAQRQQQVDAQRQVQVDRQREIQAAAQARAQAQTQAQAQAQAEAQRRAADAGRRSDAPKGAQPTPSP